MAHKKFLFVNRKAPFGTGYAAEMLEAVLIAAAFDQEVHLVYLDDGVFQLAAGQEPHSLGQKGFAHGLLDLGEYDIDHVWVEKESLAARGLAERDLAIPVTVIERAALAELMAEMDVIVSA